EAASADEARRAADADVHRWTARAEALDAALGDLRAGLAAALDGVDGVLGPAVDLITTEPGCEAAVAAALGDVLRGVVARDADAARAALARLRSTGTAGTVLVPSAQPAFDLRSLPVHERRFALAAEAAEACQRAEAALAETRTALGEARRWEAAGDKALDSHRARQAAVAAAAARLQTERAEAEAEAAALEEHAIALAAQAEAEGGRRRELEAVLPALEAAEDEERRQ